MSDVFEPTPEVAEEFRALMADPAARQAFVEMRAQAAETGAKTRYQHVLKAVSGSPWAIRPEMLAVIVDLLAFRVAGGRLSADEIDARIGAARRAPLDTPPAGVAVLALHGVIMPKASIMTEMSGGTSIEAFRSQFRQAMAATDVSGVVLDVDSPGGMVDGVPEMAAEIRAARGSKPIVAVANTEAASAAYWLATQADELVVTKSGRVGSVGVYAAHEDESQKAENEGVKTTLVSAGKFKTEGNPFEPLSSDAKAHMQAAVDEYFGMFVNDVAKGRKVSVDAVRSGFGEGREVLAREALSAGMVDRIATTEDVVAEMLGAGRLRATSAGLPEPFSMALPAEPDRHLKPEEWPPLTHAHGADGEMIPLAAADQELQDLTNTEAAQAQLDADTRDSKPDDATAPTPDFNATAEWKARLAALRVK